MNKKLLAAAITAGLMVPGLAAADVKIFGAIQAETGNADINTSGATADTDTTLMGSAGSGATVGGGPNQVGLKGSEKLGNGMTAYFKWNTAWSTFDATGVGTRDTFVGLKGDGWHVQFGRMNSAYKTASVAYDPFFTTGLQSRASGAYSGIHNGYVDDMMEVGFKSGAWSGAFQITWEDSVNDTNVAGVANTIDAGSWNGKIKYAANNWEVGAAYMDNDYGTAAGDADAFKVHGKYSTNGFTLMAQYEDVDVSTAALGAATTDGATSMLGATLGGAGGVGGFAGTGAEEYDSLHLSMTYKMSDATTLMAKYASTDWEDIGGAGGSDIDGDHWGIGVKHNLSKRTYVYGGYADNDYDRNGTASDSDFDIWAIGLRHNF